MLSPFMVYKNKVLSLRRHDDLVIFFALADFTL